VLDNGGPTLAWVLSGKATDGDGNYALRKERPIVISIRVANKSVCKEDEIGALENGWLRGEGESVEEGALEQVRIEFYHL
jgi:hypothetical protein